MTTTKNPSPAKMALSTTIQASSQRKKLRSPKKTTYTVRGRRPNNEEEECAKKKSHKNGCFGRVSGATLHSIAIAQQPLHSSLHVTTQPVPRLAGLVTPPMNADALISEIATNAEGAGHENGIFGKVSGSNTPLLCHHPRT